MALGFEPVAKDEAKTFDAIGTDAAASGYTDHDRRPWNWRHRDLVACVSLMGAEASLFTKITSHGQGGGEDTQPGCDVFAEKDRAPADLACFQPPGFKLGVNRRPPYSCKGDKLRNGVGKGGRDERLHSAVMPPIAPMFIRPASLRPQMVRTRLIGDAATPG